MKPIRGWRSIGDKQQAGIASGINLPVVPPEAGEMICDVVVSAGIICDVTASAYHFPFSSLILTIHVDSMMLII